MNKIDRDTYDNYWSMVDYGDDRNDKEIEKDASWRALHDQIPRMPLETYHNERAHLTDRRDAAKAYVKGNNFKNESRIMNKKLIRLTESDLHRIVKESVNRVLKEANFRGERLHGNNPEDWEALTSLRNNLDTYGEYSPGSMTPKEKEKHHKAWKRNYRNFDSLTDKIDDELGQKPLSPEYDERYQKYADQSSKKYHNMRKNLGLPEFYH